MSAEIAGTRRDRLTDFRVEDVRPIRDAACLAVDGIKDVLKDGLRVIDELARSAVELPQDAVLTHCEQQPLVANVYQDAFEDHVHIEGFTRHVLEVPCDLAGARI